MMPGIALRGWCVGLVLGLATGPLFAGGERGRDSSSEEQLVRLEALLDAQQQRLAELKNHLAAAQAQDQTAARVEAMKQQIREVLGEQEFRESLLPATLQAGYDGGFFIRGSDNKFLMQFGAGMQFRWTHYGTRRSNRYLLPGFRRHDRTGFDAQRIRLIIEGHAFSEDLTYEFELKGDASGAYDVRAEYAWINYRFRDEFQFRAGLIKAASTRSEMNSSATLQFVDRPMVNAVFSLDRAVGVKFWGRLFDKRLDYHLDIVNSFVEVDNRTITPDPPELDNNPGVVFHVIWHALGDNPGKDFKDQADWTRHQTPALDLGFHYAFNDDQGDRGTVTLPYPRPRGARGLGGYGNTNSNGMQLNQFGVEAAFKYMGFSATGEYIVRTLDPRRAGRRPFTSWWLLTGQGDTTVMHGAYLQLGYMLPIPGLENKLEAVARVGGISTAADGREGSWEYAGGLNYYINGNKVKL